MEPTSLPTFVLLTDGVERAYLPVPSAQLSVGTALCPLLGKAKDA